MYYPRDDVRFLGWISLPVLGGVLLLLDMEEIRPFCGRDNN